MKVLALNGSPGMKASNTYHKLKPLLKAWKWPKQEACVDSIPLLPFSGKVETPWRFIYSMKEQERQHE
jgi:hypothetical protein